jgi:hypothetical protein
MRIFLQWASLVLAGVAVGISIVTYTQVQSLRTEDHSTAAAEAVEKLRQDIATYVAQKRVVATEQAQALQQGLAQDLKKLQEVSNLKPLNLEQVFASPSASASPKNK